MRRAPTVRIAILSLALIVSGNLAAQEDGQYAAYQRVQRQLDQLQADVQALKQERDGAALRPISDGFGTVDLEPAAWTSGLNDNAPATGPPPCPHCGQSHDCLPCVSGSGDPAKQYPTVIVTGFFHLDAAWFSQDPTNIASVGDSDDGIGFRRARLAAKGNVAPRTSYIIELDIAASQARFVDVWTNFNDVPLLGNIRLGRWRQPFGMSTLTSIRELPFLERGLPFALVPFRQTGIGAFNTALDERMTWAVSAFRFPSDAFGNNEGDNGGYAMASRLTFLPVYVDEGWSLLHFGLDYSFQDPSNDSARYFSQPEILVDQSIGGVLATPAVVTPRFVDTGIIAGTRNIDIYGIEGAAALGRLYLQSEAQVAQVHLFNGSSLNFPGAYAQARYILTGETLPYDRKGGVFGRVKPRRNVDLLCGDFGAWELAARWSYLDLNDANQLGLVPMGGGPSLPGGVRGGVLNDVTLGVNWYVNDHTKFQFNYIRAFLKHPTLGKSDADIVAVRGQVDF